MGILGSIGKLVSDTISKVTGQGGGKGSSSSGGSYGGNSSSGGSGSSSGGSSSGGSSSGSGYTKYGGGNAALDADLGKYGQMYNDARNSGDIKGMRNANDWANMARNKYGYAAESANNDIEYMKQQTGYNSSGGGGGGGGGYSLPDQQVPQGQQPGQYPGQQPDYGQLMQSWQEQQQDYYAKLLAEQERKYAEIKAQEEAAKKAAVEQAVGQLAGQKTSVEQNYSDMYRQLYIDRRMAEKSLPQQMSAMGYSGGLTESSALALNTNYAEALRQGEQSKIGAMNGIDQAIANTRFSGDISIAGQAAQTAREQLATYGSVIDKMQQQNNWQQQFGYQAGRDQVADSQWNQQFGYNQFLNDRNYNYQAGRDQVADGRWNMEFGYQAGRDQVADSQWDRQFGHNQFMDFQNLSRQQLMDQIGRDDVSYDRKMQTAQYLYESAGDASGFSALGFTSEQIAAMNSSYASQMAGTNSGNGGRSGSGSGSGKAAVSGAQDYDGLFAAAMESGYPEAFISNNYKQFGFTSNSGLSNSFYTWQETRQGVSDLDGQIYNMTLRTPENLVPDEALKIITAYYKNGKISEVDAKKMAARYGMKL